jgi:hypothetical protein
VMLAVDISFLAVPAVASQAPAIVLAYLSSLCALGSLVVSLILAGQVNDSRRGSAAEVVRFLSIVLSTLFVSTGLFHGRNVTFYARPRKPCPDA